jgi:SOS-response transcriptional repressor LexA
MRYEFPNMADSPDYGADPDLEDDEEELRREKAEDLLTPAQMRVMAAVRELVREKGWPPTVREIGKRCGLASPSTVHAHLASLERAGLVVRDPLKPRALRVVEKAA